ncbi:MAG TPA: hypothetical protein PKL04_00600 [Methanofastidiosum sp.]|nr:hypothetical protein [Methanofastidiosum sp.]
MKIKVTASISKTQVEAFIRTKFIGVDVKALDNLSGLADTIMGYGKEITLTRLMDGVKYLSKSVLNHADWDIKWSIVHKARIKEDGTLVCKTPQTLASLRHFLEYADRYSWKVSRQAISPVDTYTITKTIDLNDPATELDKRLSTLVGTIIRVELEDGSVLPNYGVQTQTQTA